MSISIAALFSPRAAPVCDFGLIVCFPAVFVCQFFIDNCNLNGPHQSYDSSRQISIGAVTCGNKAGLNSKSCELTVEVESYVHVRPIKFVIKRSISGMDRSRTMEKGFVNVFDCERMTF
jgi:hypothetical protein